MVLGVPFGIDFSTFSENGESVLQDARAPELSHKRLFDFQVVSVATSELLLKICVVLLRMCWFDLD